MLAAVGTQVASWKLAAEDEAQRNRDAGEIYYRDQNYEDRNRAFAKHRVTNQRIPLQLSGWPSL